MRESMAALALSLVLAAAVACANSSFTGGGAKASLTPKKDALTGGGNTGGDGSNGNPNTGLTVAVGQSKDIPGLAGGKAGTTCTSLDASIAKVDAKTCKVTGVKAGATQIKITGPDGSSHNEGVTVVPPGGNDAGDGGNDSGSSTAGNGDGSDSGGNGKGGKDGADGADGSDASGTSTNPDGSLTSDSSTSTKLVEPMTLSQLMEGDDDADGNFTVRIQKTDANGSATGSPFTFQFHEGKAGETTIPDFCQKKDTSFFDVSFVDRDKDNAEAKVDTTCSGLTGTQNQVLQTGGGNNSPEVTVDTGSCLIGNAVDRGKDNTFRFSCPHGTVQIRGLLHQ